LHRPHTVNGHDLAADPVNRDQARGITQVVVGLDQQNFR
jgi:hypothetical protein